MNTQDEYDLRKSFNDLKNLYRAKIEKKGIVANTGNGMGEHIETDNLTVLDDFRGFAFFCYFYDDLWNIWLYSI